MRAASSSRRHRSTGDRVAHRRSVGGSAGRPSRYVPTRPGRRFRQGGAQLHGRRHRCGRFARRDRSSASDVRSRRSPAVVWGRGRGGVRSAACAFVGRRRASGRRLPTAQRARGGSERAHAVLPHRSRCRRWRRHRSGHRAPSMPAPPPRRRGRMARPTRRPQGRGWGSAGRRCGRGRHPVPPTASRSARCPLSGAVPERRARHHRRCAAVAGGREVELPPGRIRFGSSKVRPPPMSSPRFSSQISGQSC